MAICGVSAYTPDCGRPQKKMSQPGEYVFGNSIVAVITSDRPVSISSFPFSVCAQLSGLLCTCVPASAGRTAYRNLKNGEPESEQQSLESKDSNLGRQTAGEQSHENP